MNKPVILREGTYNESDIDKLKQDAVKFSDIYDQELAELFEINNPTLIFEEDFKSQQENFIKNESGDEMKGDWIFLPWSKTLIHSVVEADFHKLRTNRNKHIISEEEQQKLAGLTVGLLGMSVGSNVGMNLIYSGVGAFKLADFDQLDVTNLNRVRARLDQVGEDKIDIVSTRMYEANPYVSIEEYRTGLTEENLDEFLSSVDLVFEIIDDFKMKIRVRMEAKKHEVPIIMLTNLGDNILVDVERYDLDNTIEVFNGKIGDAGEKILAGEVTKEDEKKYAISLVGMENIPERVLKTVKEIGNTVVGRPQLMSTASVSSGIGAYVTRKIALGEKLESGRYCISLDTLFESAKQ